MYRGGEGLSNLIKGLQNHFKAAIKRDAVTKGSQAHWDVLRAPICLRRTGLASARWAFRFGSSTESAYRLH